jgi:hypothetical protein
MNKLFSVACLLQPGRLAFTVTLLFLSYRAHSFAITYREDHFNLFESEADSTALLEFTGTYKMEGSAPFDQITFFIKGDALRARSGVNPEIEFTKESENVFKALPGVLVTFVRTNGKVSHVKISAQGQEFTGQKEQH